MRRLFILLGLIVVSTGALAIQSITIDYGANTITVVRQAGDGKQGTFNYGPLLPLDNAERLAGQAALQSLFDTVILRNTLPVNHPHRLANPANACEFWSSPGQSITYRVAVVTLTLLSVGDERGGEPGEPYIEVTPCVI